MLEAIAIDDEPMKTSLAIVVRLQGRPRLKQPLTGFASSLDLRAASIKLGGHGDSQHEFSSPGSLRDLFAIR
jgi:hypothetical protein